MELTRGGGTAALFAAAIRDEIRKEGLSKETEILQKAMEAESMWGRFVAFKEGK